MLCVIVWALAFFAHLLERAAGRTVPAWETAVALTAMAVGGYGFVAMWYVSGVLGVPRRYAVQPHGTAGYSLAASIFLMVFAVGFLVLLLAFLQLGRAALARRGRPVPRDDREPVAEPPLPDVAEPAGVPLATPTQLAAGIAAIVALIFSFLPPITRAAETNTQYHHLQHAAEFLFGALIGLVVMSLPSVSRHVGRRAADLGIAAVVAAPAVMMLLMLPRIYEPLEGHDLEHASYHVGMAAFGLVAGLGAGALGRVTGRLAAVLAVGMAVMYAAGAGG
jgi:hypothetical protein